MESILDLKKWKVNKVKKLASLRLQKIRLKADLKKQKNEIKLNRKIHKIKEKTARKIAKIQAEKQPRQHLLKISVPTYSLREELINSISHGVAAVFAIVALLLLIIKANSAVEIVSVSIYGILMIILYVISCIYHALSSRILGKKVLRILDHINVMLMVAGTYTPISLVLIGGGLGWLIFSIVWIVTIVAIVFNAINVDKYQYISVGCNLILGWGALLVVPQLLTVCSPFGVLVFLIGGGAIYSLGSILYVIGAKKKYMHSVFHFFVILASVLHFLFIYQCCL